jgi:hypothetical protein
MMGTINLGSTISWVDRPESVAGLADFGDNAK